MTPVGPLAVVAALTVASAPAQLAARTGEATAPRPNILVILSDDMGWGQPGFNGGTEVETPSLDRIADEGVRLTQFYVVPSCSPTRASLISGRHHWKTGGKSERPTEDTIMGLLPDERTMAEALGDAGYATWMVGKWHLGQWNHEHLPLQRGFDHHYGFYSGTTGYYSHRVRDKLSWHRNGRPVVESGYTTFLLAEEAVQLIERHDEARPFFLYLAFNAPHLPRGVPPEYKARYAHLSNPDQRGQVKAMDDAIGWVIDALERRDMLDDTLVLFFNDNGGKARAGGNRPYRGQKGEYLEGGIRVPAAMRWPGNIAPGSETNALLHVVDLFPTFAGLAGAEPEGELPLDGVDAWQAIAGGAPSPRQELPHSLKVMRVGDWKLIEENGTRWGGGASSLQLYNIREDPYEATNLASSETAKVAELRSRLDYHRQFTRDAAPARDVPASAVVYGEQENAAYGAAVRRALRKLDAGNPGPTLVRLEAAGGRVKLVYDEELDTGSVPPADAFRVVVNPGYVGAGVTDVEMSGTDVLLTLDWSPTLDQTVGLTYEVPDSGAIRDVDRLDAVGVTWVAAPVSVAFLGRNATLSALSLSGIDIGTFSATTTEYAATVPNATSSTRVTATASDASADVSISPGATVNLAEGPNEITVTVTAADGTTVETYTVTVTRSLPAVSIAPVATPVTEGEAAEFEVTLDAAVADALAVAVSVTETGSMLSGTRPASVTVPPGASSATLSVATAVDVVAEPDSTVTASLVAGNGYVLGAAAAASIVVEDAPAPSGSLLRPNIVVFLADDMGWGQPGFNGGTEVATPHMDRIAGEGVKLAQFYVQPEGSPTRASLVTGRYAWKAGLSRNLDTERDGGLPLGERTIAEALRDAGYATWLVGKWQLGHWSSNRLPLQRGFEHHYGFYNELIDSYGHFRRWQGSQAILDWHRNGRPVVESGYATELLAGEASQLIERHDGSAPFFLLVAFNAPHGPYQAPAAYLQQYGHLDLSEDQRNQRAMVKAMDDAIGEILNALDSRGVLDETLVVFLNDNGGTSDAGGNSPYRGEKSSYLEGGVKVPAAMRWPGRITSGSVSDALLHVADLFPTFAGLAGAYTGGGLALDGVDAWAAIAEGAESPRDEVALSPKVIRAGDWKLIEKNGISLKKGVKSSVQLYNLAEDPYETTNLASSEKERVAELWERLVVQHPSLRIARLGEVIPGLGSQGSSPADRPPVVFGAAENAAYGAGVERALAQREAGNLGPTLERLEAATGRVKLVYDEALDPGSVPPEDAFTVVVNPGYTPVGVTDVEVSGTDVVLTLDWSPTLDTTVGLTYEVPDSGAIRDVDRLDAVGVTWVAAPVSTAFLGQDPLPAFTMSVETGVLREGQSATLTVEITNGVTFAEDQTVDLSVSGTASAADYSLTPSTLTLGAGASSATVVLAAEEDQEEEEDETVTVAATHEGAAVASVTVTIESVSHDATLSALSLSGIDIGIFSSGTTEYTASVPNSTTTTTVTATASHSAASVTIEPGADVTLAEGANEITVTVTAEDGVTTGTYTVTVERTSLPVATLAAGDSPVTEGTAATFTVSLDKAVSEPLSVSVSVEELGAARSGDSPTSVAFAKGESSATLSVPTAGDAVVEAESTVTASLMAGIGYVVGSVSSASVTVEDDDAATFTVSVEPASVAEGESATLTVAVSNGVTFAEAQTISLAASGTASASDYTGLPSSLTLVAGAVSATATLAAATDQEDEQAETVTVTASHGGSEIGSATLTIVSVSHDATLSALSLSGIDIGTFSSGTTAYAASVPNPTSSTTVTATASHSAAGVSISPGAEVSLAEGSNEIVVTVTAEDGVTTGTYTVTVERTSLPRASIVAVAGRVSEGERAEFRVSLSKPAREKLTVGLRWTRSDQSESVSQYAVFHAGTSVKTPSFMKSDDKVVREDLRVALTLLDGEGYVVSGNGRSAEVVVKENDEARFELLIEPDAVTEGETATIRARITNGVTFGEAQTIKLRFEDGTATMGTDYTLSGDDLTLREGEEVPTLAENEAYLTLRARKRGVKAVLTAREDTEQEGGETVRIGAEHDGEVVETEHEGEVLQTRTLTISDDRSTSVASGQGVLRTATFTHDSVCSGGLCRALTDVPVTFSDTGTGAGSRVWDFADGTMSRAARPAHAWSEPGFYEVTLTAGDGVEESTATETFLVEPSKPAGTCVADADTRCLVDSRYAVEVEWWAGDDRSGNGLVVPAGTNDSGLFRFFGGDNWEILIKVLDGCAVNGHVWVFGAGTTSLGYRITVTDTVSGTVKEYVNDLGTSAATITDANALPEACRP